ncbi:NAD(P)-dependent oxidoreductase [Desulfotomaculum copahuensis]|uniref:Hydroxyacid dehydrogenase n=1 Tax=Desulfotomaculum copahuensis TaxID=1838280 RepID=A0A1B7LCN6_9FIRM|nr:NAD(P)-dependent oxidoreductase [Desulfotomaculum copahuensis]OAT80671.1 hypothetical protein A6M21_13120 [Desulfotomaculum copahuensis]
MQLIIVDDGTLTARALCRELPPALAPYPVMVQIVHSAMKTTVTALRTGEAEQVREYYGSPAELAAKVTGADILVVHKSPVTEDVIAAAPGLRLIACARAHPVNVDLKAARRRRIPVVHAPGRAAESAADLTVALLLCLARNLYIVCRENDRGGAKLWQYENRSRLEGMDLAGKTLGIIGFGQVGRRVAARALAFHMQILVYSPHVNRDEIIAAGAGPAALEELLSAADFISLHTRPRADKTSLIGAPQLALMKKSACLVNTARGELIDENALFAALKEKRIRAAALDVLCDEPPPPDHPFFTLPNILLVPHLGGKTKEAPANAAAIVTREVANFLSGRPLEHLFKENGS